MTGPPLFSIFFSYLYFSKPWAKLKGVALLINLWSLGIIFSSSPDNSYIICISFGFPILNKIVYIYCLYFLQNQQIDTTMPDTNMNQYILLQSD